MSCISYRGRFKKLIGRLDGIGGDGWSRSRLNSWVKSARNIVDTSSFVSSDLDSNEDDLFQFDDTTIDLNGNTTGGSDIDTYPGTFYIRHHTEHPT